jgi:hypothetical protein
VRFYPSNSCCADFCGCTPAYKPSTLSVTIAGITSQGTPPFGALCYGLQTGLCPCEDFNGTYLLSLLNPTGCTYTYNSGGNCFAGDCVVSLTGVVTNRSGILTCQIQMNFKRPCRMLCALGGSCTYAWSTGLYRYVKISGVCWGSCQCIEPPTTYQGDTITIGCWQPSCETKSLVFYATESKTAGDCRVNMNLPITQVDNTGCCGCYTTDATCSVSSS